MPLLLYLRGKSPRIGGRVDQRAGPDDMEKTKFLPYRDSSSDPSLVQPVASRYTDCAIPAPLMKFAHRKFVYKLM
jgi:hypothetical protein